MFTYLSILSKKKNLKYRFKVPILRYLARFYNQLQHKYASNLISKTDQLSHLARFTYRTCRKTKWDRKILLIALDAKYVHLSIYAVKNYTGQVHLARFWMWRPMVPYNTHNTKVMECNHIARALGGAHVWSWAILSQREYAWFQSVCAWCAYNWLNMIEGYKAV